MKRPLGAQISHMLKSRGVEVIFGIPGVHNVELYRGIEEAGLTHVLARHEQGAGFMADGYARATGRPGVAFTITGPGLTNILTPLGQAYSDSVPLLVISSCLDETAATRGQLHQMRDQRAAAATVCDWSEEARTAEAAYTLIDRALTEFQMDRSRPKHLQVPICLLGATAHSAPASDLETPSPILASGSTWIDDVASALAEARRPLFIFGGGAVGNQSERFVEKVLDHYGAAAFTTYAGRGLVSPDYPLYFGSTLARPTSPDILKQSDLVIVVGASLDEVDLWRSELGHDCRLIRVDTDPEVLYDRHAADWPIRNDARDFMQTLTIHGLRLGGGESDWTPEDVAATRAHWRAEADAERPGIVPICDALRTCLPDDTMIYSDMTQFAYVAKEVWDMPRPGHWHHPTGFGTLGYAMPAAIGGAVARRAANLPTLAIAGDYGFQYTLQELGTAVELGLPLPILLWDNGRLKEIEDSMVASQIAPNAVVARNPDFLKLAAAYGARAAQPATLAELQRDVLTALRADRPTLIRMTPALTA
ncbi:thiamine pyrophosphate-binding protein [Marimonas arenosa]|uniref:Thiamine pyrophosphate-binding protein n=1 Tax=Marimonas arenosa TaxID=1795305 RepID=A0AAE3WG41_9RHOB|nr:thiamine pyrophosphate-binding protein [Marimonas arenosa]MDQ2092009.1 thiamine pyrophosphate-binding protein [Marimonas arenosa]